MFFLFQARRLGFIFSLSVFFSPLSCPAEPPEPLGWSRLWAETSAVALSPWRGGAAGYAAVLAGGAGLAAGLRQDLPWYQQVQAGRNAWQDAVMPAATLLGDGWIQVAGPGLLYLCGSASDQTAAVMALEGQLQVLWVSQLGKILFTASRPSADPAQRSWFTGVWTNGSFPSGHSMSAFCAAVLLGDAYHLEWLSYPLAGLVAYSRVYNQKHWPSDTIAGAGLGLWIGFTVLDYYHSGRREAAAAKDFRLALLPVPDGVECRLTWNF